MQVFLLTWIASWLAAGWWSVEVARVDFTPNTITCDVGQTVAVKATPYRRNGSAIPDLQTKFFTKSLTTAAVARTGNQTAKLSCRKTGTTFVGGGYRGKRDSSRTTVTCSLADAGSLALSPDSVVFATVGDTVRVTSAVINACNEPDTLLPVTFVSRNSAIFTVVSAGVQEALLTAVGPGSAYLTGTAGSALDSIKVCFLGTSVDVTPSSASFSVGQTEFYTAAISDCTGTVGTAPAWVSRNPSVATLTTGAQTTTVTGVGAGESYIVATHSSVADSGLAIVSAAPTPSACDGIDVAAGSSIQTAINAAGTGDTLCLLAGTHRLQQNTPKASQVFIGEGIGVTILSGAKVLSGFNAESGRWWVGGQTQQGPTTDPARCEAGQTDCQWPEDLFFDDNVLKDRVSTLGAVGPGKWFFDYAADKIYIGDDPTGHTVETSAATYAFRGTASGVKIQQMTVEKYATPAQRGTIGEIGNASAWTLEDVRARQAHGTCVKVGAKWVVRRVRVDHCGQLGISGGETGSLIEDGEWDHNKTVGFNVGFAGGASKFHGSTNVIIRNIYAHHNDGNGIWLDIDNQGYLVENNRVEDNFGQGIFVEISFGGVIRNNQVRRNGYERGGSWLYGAGILVAHSADVEVYGNLVADNYNGIAGIQQNRTNNSGVPYLLKNLYVHNNTVCQTRGKTGIGDQTTGGPAYGAARNNRFEDNDYEVPTSGGQWWTWSGGGKDWTQWNALGWDTPGGSRTVVSSC